MPCWQAIVPALVFMNMSSPKCVINTSVCQSKFLTHLRVTPACNACSGGMFGYTAHKTGSKTVSTFLNRLLAMRMADQARLSLPPRLLCLTHCSCEFL